MRRNDSDPALNFWTGHLDGPPIGADPIANRFRSNAIAGSERLRDAIIAAAGRQYRAGVESMSGASLRDRAGRVSPGAGSRLRHPATIPCAKLFDLNLSGYSLGIAPEPRIGIFWPPRGRNMIFRVQQRVAEYFDIPEIEMTSARRHRGVARPRQVAMYLCRELTGHSLPEIGRRFGKRNHTTVIHAIKTIEHLCRNDAGMKEDVAILRSEFAV